jgi:auxin efflux carrier family
MISGSAVYQVLEAMAPLYTAAALGYVSVRWLKAFSDEQCAGINHFVALYAVPVLIFHMVSTNDLYAMSGRLIAADTLQKLAILLGLVAPILWARSRRHRDDDGTKAAPSLQLEWVVTAFSVASLPNTIIMGVPLLRGMYGEVSTTLLKPIVVMQFCFWYNVIIFLYEYMEAMRAAATVTKEIISPPGSPEKGDPMRVVIIETTDVTVASLAQGSIVVQTNTTSVGKDKEAGTFGDVAKAPSVKHVLWMAVKKILRIPNTYASILGLIWSLVAFKYVHFIHVPHNIQCVIPHLHIQIAHINHINICHALFPILQVWNQDAKSYRRLPLHNIQHSCWPQHVLFRSVYTRSLRLILTSNARCFQKLTSCLI